MEANIITIAGASSNYTKGDEALLDLFRKEDCYAVATDDAKLTSLLKKIAFHSSCLV